MQYELNFPPEEKIDDAIRIKPIKNGFIVSYQNKEDGKGQAKWIEEFAQDLDELNELLNELYVEVSDES